MLVAPPLRAVGRSSATSVSLGVSIPVVTHRATIDPGILEALGDGVPTPS